MTLVALCVACAQQAILDAKVKFLRTVQCLQAVSDTKLRRLAAVTTLYRHPVDAVIAEEGSNVDPL